MGHAVVEWLATTEWSVALHESQYAYSILESEWPAVKARLRARLAP